MDHHILLHTKFMHEVITDYSLVYTKKLLLEWSSHPKDIVGNVHNDRDPVRLQDPYCALCSMIIRVRHFFGKF